MDWSFMERFAPLYVQAAGLTHWQPGYRAVAGRRVAVLPGALLSRARASADQPGVY